MSDKRYARMVPITPTAHAVLERLYAQLAEPKPSKTRFLSHIIEHYGNK